jgi:hypothetical protein
LPSMVFTKFCMILIRLIISSSKMRIRWSMDSSSSLPAYGA